jgi:hypothetical protein
VSVSPRARQTQIPERAVDVLTYFLRNPQAADTLEGVARWRLLEEDVHRSVREVGDAIAWLIEHDFLRQESREDGSRAEPLFRLNEGRIERARHLVRHDRKRRGRERQHAAAYRRRN